jgi:hypothetical protein
MSIKSKVLATAATLALVGGVGTAGVLGTAAAANAATPPCGFTCVDIFSQEFGHHFSPGFLLDVFQAHARIGQPIILYRSSNNDPAEDFRATDQGTVGLLTELGLITNPALSLHYGCVPAAQPAPCAFGAINDPAFEIEYTPDGVDSGLCVGVNATAFQEEDVTLEECGASDKTVWVLDTNDQPFDFFVLHYAPLINGSDTNFSQPFVLTYPQSGYPTDKPRPVLEVDNLSGYTTGFPPFLNFPSVDDNQMWGADFGTHV